MVDKILFESFVVIKSDHSGIERYFFDVPSFSLSMIKSDHSGIERKHYRGNFGVWEIVIKSDHSGIEST